MRNPRNLVHDMARAVVREQPVTITYVTASGTGTVRTIEPYAIETTARGDRIVRSMDRQSGEFRSWRMDRITAHTLHRGAFQVKRPTTFTDTTLTYPLPVREPAPVTDWAAAWGAWREETYDPDGELWAAPASR
jgi:predicted DNA-binding transcriptional regulator YafY